MAAAKAHRRLRRRRPAKAVTMHLSVFLQPLRDWAEGLPLDVVLCIFSRLDQVQIMMGADKVCRFWRRAAREEPELWRRIDLRGHADLAYRGRADLDEMAAVAVLRSRGQCRAFWGECPSDHDGFLLVLAHQAPLLKSLILIACHGISDKWFKEAIKMFPLLEELQLSNCWNLRDRGVLEVVAAACPRLKHLRHHRPYWRDTEEHEDREAMGIAMMHELCSLQLFRNQVTNEGLAAILDNCPHMESLDLRNCYYIDFDDAMRAKCARIKTKQLFTSYASHGHCEDFEPASPIRNYHLRNDTKRWTYLDLDDYADYYDPCYGLDLYDENDLVVHDRMLCKSVRRYLNMEWAGIM